MGEVPSKMYAQLVREERFGEPTKAFQIEVVDVPELADDECLVLSWQLALIITMYGRPHRVSFTG